jgi:hypothetical protein
VFSARGALKINRATRRDCALENAAITRAALHKFSRSRQLDNPVSNYENTSHKQEDAKQKKLCQLILRLAPGLIIGR